MTKTEHYELNQWAGDDPVVRTDFNEDNAKIDAAIASRGNCHMVTGTYTGTGIHGPENPTVLTLGFRPTLLIVGGDKAFGIFVAGQTSTTAILGSLTPSLSVNWREDGVSWSYVTSAGDYAAHQLNAKGKEYSYVALK